MLEVETRRRDVTAHAFLPIATMALATQPSPSESTNAKFSASAAHAALGASEHPRTYVQYALAPPRR